MKNNYNRIQVYMIWVNGRDIEDIDQHFPIHSNINYNNWHSDLKLATNDYFDAKVKNIASKDGYYSEIYQDYIITLFCIDINIDEFEKMYNLEFDLNNDNVQELIPYYCDYDFNVIAERIDKFE